MYLALSKCLQLYLIVVIIAFVKQDTTVQQTLQNKLL